MVTFQNPYEHENKFVIDLKNELNDFPMIITLVNQLIEYKHSNTPGVSLTVAEWLKERELYDKLTIFQRSNMYCLTSNLHKFFFQKLPPHHVYTILLDENGKPCGDEIQVKGAYVYTQNKHFLFSLALDTVYNVITSLDSELLGKPRTIRAICKDLGLPKLDPYAEDCLYKYKIVDEHRHSNSKYLVTDDLIKFLVDYHEKYPPNKFKLYDDELDIKRRKRKKKNFSD